MNTSLPSDSSTMDGAISGCLLIYLLQLHVSHVLETVVLATSDATISFCGPANAKRADGLMAKGLERTAFLSQKLSIANQYCG